MAKSIRKFNFLATVCLSGGLLFSACQAPTGLPQKAVPLQARSLASAPLSSSDGDAELLREDLPQDFAQGLRKDQIEIQTDGQLTLTPTAPQGEYLSHPLEAPFAFRSLMVAWKGQGPLQVNLRVQNQQGQWGHWQALTQMETELSHLSAPSEPGFRALQYQVKFMTAPGRPPSFDGISFSLGQSAQASPPPTQLPSAPNPFPKPPITSRAAWGALPPTGEYTPHEPNGIVIHHTWRPDQSQYQGAASIRGIQRYHMETRKWIDIGYHFIISPDGEIFQGRPETVIGAHSVPNTGKIGICLIGDYDPGQDPFTPASREKLLDLMTWLSAEYHINPDEFYGHRDFSPKSCPGDSIYNHLDEFKAEVKRRLASGNVTPPLFSVP